MARCAVTHTGPIDRSDNPILADLFGSAIKLTD